MINKKDLMNEARFNPERLKRYALTPQQIRILDFMEDEGISITSVDLAMEFGISVPNASTQLSSLHQKEYVNKIPTEQDSGGLIYRYKMKCH